MCQATDSEKFHTGSRPRTRLSAPHKQQHNSHYLAGTANSQRACGTGRKSCISQDKQSMMF
jgi:hypothetical protein